MIKNGVQVSKSVELDINNRLFSELSLEFKCLVAQLLYFSHSDLDI